MKTLWKSFKITIAFCIFFSLFYILVLWIFAQFAGPNKGNAEVATLKGNVVGAANAMGAEVSNNAIIVKMIRVMMLVPVLLVIAWTVARDVAKRDNQENTDTNKPKISIPWFAILFLVVIGFNSLDLLPESIVDWINQLDTFLLTMSMAALGAETSFDKFKKAGIKPFLLAAILYCWLIGGVKCLVK